MKVYYIPLAIAIAGAAVFAASSAGDPHLENVPETDTTLAEERFSGEEESGTEIEKEKFAKLDLDIADVQRRVKISAPMELVEDGPDAIAEAVANGFIVEATLEEVEAALTAAAATLDEEDDKRALELRHRGSYRFFSPSLTTPSIPKSSSK